MKITINHYHAVAMWRWNLKPASTADQPTRDGADTAVDEDDEDDEDDVCGICRVAFDGCCPDCKVPGDGCPPIWGECTHVFHMHCLMKWLDTESSKQQCPMDRRPWVTVLWRSLTPSPAVTAGIAASAPQAPALLAVHPVHPGAPQPDAFVATPA